MKREGENDNEQTTKKENGRGRKDERGQNKRITKRKVGGLKLSSCKLREERASSLRQDTHAHNTHHT